MHITVASLHNICNNFTNSFFWYNIFLHHLFCYSFCEKKIGTREHILSHNITKQSVHCPLHLLNKNIIKQKVPSQLLFLINMAQLFFFICQRAYTLEKLAYHFNIQTNTGFMNQPFKNNIKPSSTTNCQNCETKSTE